MKLFCLIFILLFFFPLSVRGASLGEVFINEIVWMGTTVSYNDEWIELYNSTENNISLEGWVLKADDGAPEINLTGEIPANGFYLLERTNDETMPGVPADLIYKGALGNDGENLKLFDNLGDLIDQANFGDGWPAGDNGAKLTMERIDSGWQTSQEPGGTPKAENSLTEVGPPQIEASKPVEVGPLPTYPKGIVFNEILASPEGPDAEEEYIKIFNQNNFEVDLSGWQIKDTAGKITTYALDTKIKELSSLRLSRPETKITLNNDGDGLELLNPKGEVIDSVNFTKAPQGQAYIKTSSGWAWSGGPAPVSEVNPQIIKKQTADIDLSIQKSKPPVLLIALIITIFSAIVILILKKINFTKLS